MKKELLDKFKHALLTKEQKAAVIGGYRPCTVTSSPGCSCVKAPSGCETITCKGSTGEPHCF